MTNAREHLYKSEAVVIRRSDLGEADKILTIFTPHFGKLRVVAKGVRKVTSRLAGWNREVILPELERSGGLSGRTDAASR